MPKGQRDRRILFALPLLCSLALTLPVNAQQQPPEDPEHEKQLGLWLDQTLSVPRSPNRSLEFEAHELLDNGASNLFETFFQAGIAFRVRPWLTVMPAYRYLRFPGNSSVAFENRLLLNLTFSKSRGAWRPVFRTSVEGRIPDNRPASARIRLRPGVEYTLPLRLTRRPVVIVNNEFFLVPGTNSFFSSYSFTQNRFQAGVRLPISPLFSVRTYYMLQSIDVPAGWDNNHIIGLSLNFRLRNRSRP
jgi:hypothetical protein